jgi:hypothetical protein
LWTGAGDLAMVFAAGRPLASGRVAGFAGFAGVRFGAALAFLIGRFDAAFARAGRGIAFFAKRLRALAAVFFPFTFAIVKKEWRSIAVSRFPVEGFRGGTRQFP